MNVKIIACLALLASVGMVGSQSATAATRWTLPGVACKAYSASSNSYFTTYYDTGLTRTSTSGSGWVVCPVQRTGNPYSFYVSLYHPTSRSTSCYVYRSNYLTGTTTVSPAATFSGSGNKNFSVTTPSSTGLTSDDHYALECSIASGTVVRGWDWAM